MILKEILSIAGKPGLFKNVAQSKNGVIVESISDGKRFPVFAHDKLSSLEEISVFTTGEDIPLKVVLKQIFDKEKGGLCTDPKSEDKTLREYFKSVVPDYDEERVYISHIRKILVWYNLLQAHQLLVWDDELPEAEGTTLSEPKGSQNE